MKLFALGGLLRADATNQLLHEQRLAGNKERTGETSWGRAISRGSGGTKARRQDLACYSRKNKGLVGMIHKGEQSEGRMGSSRTEALEDVEERNDTLSSCFKGSLWFL